MVRIVERLGCLLLGGLAACAQQEAPKIVVNLDDFRYPTIARAARIQGEVVFEVSASGIRLVTGHPILSPGARMNLETWTFPPFESGNYLVRYQFLLGAELGTKQVTALVGDRLDRFFLRLFHAPTTRVSTVCDSNIPTKTQVLQTPNKEGGDYEIDVSVESGGTCLNAP